MKLTRYTDYALRVLMHLAVQPGQLTSISTIARAYGISQNHLVKVVQDLRVAGYVDAVRGRAGGIRLARPPEEINVGEVVRHAETGLQPGRLCPLSHRAGLRPDGCAPSSAGRLHGSA